MRKWTDVEDDLNVQWQNAYSHIFKHGNTSPTSCPGCNSAPLRVAYVRFKPGEPRGGGWIWCPSCLRYEHYSCYVPEWWNDIWDGIPAQLEHNPEWLENNLHAQFGK